MRFSARDVWLLVVAAFALSLTSISTAQPIVLQEEQRVALPTPYFRASDVCIYGDDLLIAADRIVSAIPNQATELAWTLIHFRRQADRRWEFINEIAAVGYDDSGDIWVNPRLDCDGPLVAMSTAFGALAVEHTSAGWRATGIGPPRVSTASAYRDAIAIGNDSRGPTTITIVRKDASGRWANVTYADGNPGSLTDVEDQGPARIWLAATELVANSSSYLPEGQNGSASDTQLFDFVNGAWRLTTLPLHRGAAVIADRIALQKPAWKEPGEVGAYVVRDASGAWSIRHALMSDELISPVDARFFGDRVFAQIERNRGEIALFRAESLRRYRHVATFSRSDAGADPFGPRLSQFSVHGEQIAAIANNAVYLFRAPPTLPAPRLLEHTFQSAGAPDWTFSGDASWSVVSSSGTRMLRQTRSTGGAFAILGASESDNQSIQADVRINELGAGTPWAGFVLRYTDARNYYYLLVNRTSVQIRKIVNGSYGPIARAPLSLTPGRWYNFRLEAIGSRLRMFVNGRQVGEVIDGAHARGRAGLTMWRARTDYDNVIVTDAPQTELFVDDFNDRGSDLQTPWRAIAPANAWSVATLSNGERVYRQNLISGGPRTVNGGVTRDQIVSVSVRPTAFDAAGNGWVGVMARYTDNYNNYFLMLHQSGRASLRKRVNGVYTVIEEVPFTVTRNTTYRLRIEAIGSSLRVYVNERLLAEGVDDDLPNGRYGLVTFNTRADFDDFKAIRP